MAAPDPPRDAPDKGVALKRPDSALSGLSRSTPSRRPCHAQDLLVAFDDIAELELYHPIVPVRSESPPEIQVIEDPTDRGSPTRTCARQWLRR